MVSGAIAVFFGNRETVPIRVSFPSNVPVLDLAIIILSPPECESNNLAVAMVARFDPEGSGVLCAVFCLSFCNYSFF